MFSCDLAPEIGVGHLMRCVALAEEFAARGAQVVFAVDVEAVPWAAEQLRTRGFATVRAPGSASGHLDTLAQLSADLVVIDSYLLPPEVYAAVRGAGFPLLALTDGELGGREADLYLDQNIGAERRTPPLPVGARRLAGLEYALIRDEILDARGETSGAAAAEHPRVFAFFGGTDAHQVAPVATELLAATGLPWQLTVVAASDAIARDLRAISLHDGQRVTVIAPTTRLATYVRRADVVIAAAGSASWELLCLGSATGLICVADNQAEAYGLAREADTAEGLGHLADVRADPGAAIEGARRLLSDDVRRAELRDRGRLLVDGEGRRRVATECVRMLADRPERRAS